MAKPIQVTTDNLESEVKSANVAIIDFTAVWCRPCKKYDPVFEELAEEYEGKAAVCKVDIGVQPTVAQEFSVMSAPTIIFLKNGQIADRIAGVVTKDKLTEKLDSLLI